MNASRGQLERVRIKVVSTGRWIEQSTFETFCRLLVKHDAIVEVAEQCFWRHGQLAGADDVRARTLIDSLNDSTADVIWCARGGYGSARILDGLTGLRNVSARCESDIVMFALFSNSYWHNQILLAFTGAW